jgi:ATP-dependent Clp protease ATP-binding subunit ClpA
MEETKTLDSSNLNQKIKIEKRKRHQVYTTFDYVRSQSKKFDFFSYDSINIIQTANSLIQNFRQKKVTPEILLLSFFKEDLELTKILKKFNITFELLEEYLFHGYKITNSSDQKVNIFSSLKRSLTFLFEKQIDWKETIDTNYELKNLIEKSIENSYRFKTPAITPELLFLTLLEENTLAANILLKKFLKTDLNWTLLRYEILKKLHNQETFKSFFKIPFTPNLFNRFIKK